MHQGWPQCQVSGGARRLKQCFYNPNRDPTRDQLLSLIFRPGFSTTDGVTELAGRGVGMDVVAQQAKALRGRVSLDTEDGGGTTVTFTVPLLAVVSNAA
jgi:chemotaxis protein histidine kinase CheA